MAIFSKEDWKDYGRWVQPTLSGCFWNRWNESAATKAVFADVSFEWVLFLDGHTLVQNRDTKSMELYLEKIQHHAKIEELTRKIEFAGTKTEKVHLAILKKKEHPVIYLQELFSTYQDMAGFWWMALQFSDVVEAFIKTHLKMNHGELVREVELLRKKTWLEEQSDQTKQLARLVLKKNPKIKSSEFTLNFLSKNTSILSAVKSHVKKFAWFGTHHWDGEPYSQEKCVQEIQKLLENEIPSEPKKMKPKNFNPLIALLASLSYWRTHSAETTAKVVFESRPLMEKVASENGLTYEEFTYLSATEILSHLSRHQKLPNKLKERKAGWGTFIDKSGGEHVLHGFSLQEAKDSVLEKTDSSVSQVKGMTASHGGIIQGIVRLVIAPHDVNHFLEGEIMVSPETTPDFVPIMKKAAGIVTDRGGVTSHAAIISREIGVPCIVGTGKATSVFKNGDRVEMDTIKGIVKKLS